MGDPKPRHYLSVEQPDQEVTIDFLTFHPEEGVKVEGVTVKLKLEYDENKQEAKLSVIVNDEGKNYCAIILDECVDITVDIEDDPDEDTIL